MILFEYVNRVLAWHQNRDRGASAVEYALIVGAIVAIIGVFVFAMGDQVRDLIWNSCNQINGGTGCAAD